MLRYYCRKCETSCLTSDCPVCGGRTEPESSVYWCDECNIPVWDDLCPLCGKAGRAIATDLRPVFPRERLLLELLTTKPLCYRDSSVWFGSGRYIVDGRPVRLSSALWQKTDPAALRREIDRLAGEACAFEKYIALWTQANRARCEAITSEAMLAIQEAARQESASRMFVSFSGGKDSTVTSSLVTRALGTPSIIHIFGDTTLEFPETRRYIERFRRDNRKTPLLTARNDEKDFSAMCEIVGPPSRVKRWCCILFKTGAITRKIEKTFPGAKHLMTFYGIRRSESNSRSKYERDTHSPKIAKQRVFSPIIDWLEYDIWLYLLSNGIDFNDAYRCGYTRVGCWCCPNNSRWSEFLSKIYMPEESAA